MYKINTKLLEVQIPLLLKHGITVEKYRLGDVWLVFEKDRELFIGNKRDVSIYVNGLMAGFVNAKRGMQ